MAGIEECNNNPQLAVKTNILGTENLLQALKDIKLDKFIHASTGGIYSWKSKVLNEKITLVDPKDNYSVTKFTNEKQIYFWSKITSNNLPNIIASTILVT